VTGSGFGSMRLLTKLNTPKRAVPTIRK
jgi:hypothetical protein